MPPQLCRISIFRNITYLVAEISPEEERRLQIERIVALATASNEREVQRRNELDIEFNRSIDESAAESIAEIEALLASIEHPARAIPHRVLEIEERQKEGERRIRERFVAQKEKNEQASLELANSIHDVSVESIVRFAESDRQLALAKQRGATLLAGINLRVDENFKEVLKPIAREIEDYAGKTLERMQRTGIKDQKAVEEFDRLLRQAQVKIDQLEKENDRLRNEFTYTSNKLERVGQKQIIAQQGIEELNISVREMSKRNKVNLLSMVAMIGAGVLSSWALQSILMSTGSSINGYIVPSKGGLQLELLL